MTLNPPLLFPSECAALQALHDAGESPTALCRHLLSAHPYWTPRHLMLAIEEAFGLPQWTAGCLGAWRDDGTGPLPDDTVDRLLNAAIHSVATR